MRRLLPFVVIALVLAAFTPSAVAQDATPVDSGSMISELGYPVIEYTTDGTTLSGPTELEAGRYLLRVVSTSPIQDWELSFYAPTEGMTGDELLAELAAMDLMAPAPPEIYFEIGHAGGVGSPSTEAIVQLTEGEWVAAALFFGETAGSVATQKVTVSGELSDYPAIEGSVEVTLADLTIEMPDTLAAGPQIWQVTNTGAMLHFVFIMKPDGEVTTEDAVNGVKLFYGMADATPVAEGSAQDPMTWQDVGGSPTISTGVTTFFEVDLEPGTYIASCFIEGPGELGSHALYGMTKVFTVE